MTRSGDGQEAQGADDAAVDAAVEGLEEAQQLLDAYRIDEAAELAAAAVVAFGRALGPGSPDLANALLVLSRADQARGEYGPAVRHGRWACDVMRIAEASGSGEGTGGVVGLLHSYCLLQLGEALVAAGRYAEADDVLLRALARTEAVDRESLDTARCLNALGLLGKYRGTFEHAEQCYRRALAICERVLGPAHADVATIWHNLGGLEHARGRCEAGEPLARRAVALREAALGPDDVRVALDRAALGALLVDLGELAEAEECMESALRVITAERGSTHPEVAPNLHNLAAIARLRGDLDRATRLYSEALHVKELSLGPSHPDVADTLVALADAREAGGAPDEAAALRERALVVLGNGVSDSHPTRLNSGRASAEAQRQHRPLPLQRNSLTVEFNR